MSDDKTKTDERVREEDDTAVTAQTEADKDVDKSDIDKSDIDKSDIDKTDGDKSEDTGDADKAGDAQDADKDEADSATEDSEKATKERPKRKLQWSRVFAFGLLPALALILALGAGYLKWQDDTVRNSELASISAVQAAKDGTIALLSYQPDTVEQQLGDARNLLTGEFRESYTSLTNDVVIPGAKEKQISAVASVPAAASVSATADEAVVLLFVNQTVTVGQDPPTDTASSVRVTLEKDGDRWLIAKFDPV
ncbi:hypothetical protein [Mycolicibacterium sp.]|uniref:hypothetical protein n=1 Tax=Mycolicibacterium sp. TaxID=2320850 RepID=UPI003D0ED5F4